MKKRGEQRSDVSEGAPWWWGSRAGVWMVVAAGLGALGLSGCGRGEAERSVAAAAEAAPVAVRVVAVVREELPVAIEATGTVRAVQRAAVAAKVMGVIEELPVLLGQRVKRGEVLARIAAADLSARVRQAQVALEGLRRDLARERGLEEKGAGTREAVASLQDRIAGAEAAVKEAEAMLDFATVRAPFDGAVARRMADAGDLASPGVALLELEGTDRFEVEAEVPESVAARVSVGASVEMTVPAAGLNFTARVSEIAAAAEARSRTVTVKVAVPDGRAVRSGQHVRIQIPGAPAAAVLVPASAVAAIGQIERVFVVGAEGRVALRIVKTGGRRGERVEVVAGLNGGERVVDAPPAGLKDGQRVENLR